MIYNAVSVKSVIAKVYRDLNIEDPSFELDAIEWMGEALEWIGTGMPSVDKEEWIIATNHTATLPSDLNVLKGVWVVNNAPLKDNWENEEFPYDLSQVQDLNKYKLERSDEQLHEGIGDSSTDLPEDNLYDGSDDWRTIFQELQGEDEIESDVNEVGYNSAENYHLNGNQLKTSFETGLVLIAYKGFPLDDDGYPLIPDDIAYKEALFWYIAKKLSLGGKNLPFDWSEADQMWNKRCTQARNRHKFPDLDEYEKFLQSWTKMVETQRFNKGNLLYELEDGRTGVDPGPTGDYRVTEDGVERITEDGDTRLIE